MKTFFQSWEGICAAISGAILATWTLLSLLPKILKVCSSFYEGAMFTLEIKEHLQHSQKDMLAKLEETRREILEHLAHIDDGQINLIETRRHMSDADTSCVWFLTDSAGQTQWVNDTWTKVTGIPTEEALGNGWELGVCREDLPRVINAWRMAVEHGRRHVDEYSLVCHRTGKRTKVQVTANPIKRPDGSILSYFGCARITPGNVALASPEP